MYGIEEYSSEKYDEKFPLENIKYLNPQVLTGTEGRIFSFREALAALSNGPMVMGSVILLKWLSRPPFNRPSLYGTPLRVVFKHKYTPAEKSIEQLKLTGCGEFQSVDGDQRPGTSFLEGRNEPV
jgi:hypothetical protein